VKILVTGGAGFIGSHAVDAYVKKGHEVAIVDNLSTGKRENLNPKAKFHRADIRSKKAKEIIASFKPDIINHHAAQISVPLSVENPLLDADINIMGLLNILEAARAGKTKKIIFSSTGGAIYGEAKEFPTPETSPPKPLSPYAVTKAAGENYIASYSRQFGLDYTILRYSNVYGPRQIPHGEAGVVSIFIERLLSNKPCTIYCYSGQPKGMTRDYCYVGDVAKANILALKKGGREVLNIGTGIETPTTDLFEAIYGPLEKNVRRLASLKNPKKGPARAGDIKRSCLDAEKAEKVLGWKARVNLKEGIEKTVEWYLKKR